MVTELYNASDVLWHLPYHASLKGNGGKMSSYIQQYVALCVEETQIFRKANKEKDYMSLNLNHWNQSIMYLILRPSVHKQMFCKMLNHFQN